MIETEGEAKSWCRHCGIFQTRSGNYCVMCGRKLVVRLLTRYCFSCQCEVLVSDHYCLNCGVNLW